ncbi:MAG: xylulokinase, partial [Verrucomicrobia bacterium]|nr:xylulokinase [Verrucomicrobiota bacterium]
MEALLGIDLGTSSVKVVVASLSGQQLGVGTAEYPIQTPAPGWAVQDPEQWWNATCAATQQAIQMAGNTKILGIGFSGQMHGPLLLDTKRRPVGGAIIWADQRGGAVLGDIQDRIEPSVLAQRCGTAPAAGFLISTLFWLKRFQPETLRAADIALLPKDYVRFRLTGEIGSDPSDAAATGLFDISEGAWAWDLIEKLELPARLFPSLLPSAAMAGRLTPEAAAALGLDVGTPVATGSADQPAQASANGLFDPGLSSITLGTGGQVFVPLD